MTDCVPVLVAKAIAAEIQAATWSVPVSVGLSCGDFAEDFENINDGGVLVDVVPNARPGFQLDGEMVFDHAIKTVVAIRRRIERTQRDSRYQSIPFDEVSRYINFWYEMAKWFMPSASVPTGRRLTTLQAAASMPPFDVVAIYDPDKIKTGLYLGIMRVTYRYTEAA